MTQGFHAMLHPYKVSTFTDSSVKFCPNGFRLSVIRWKQTTDKLTGKVTPAKSAVCVPVPVVVFAVEPASLADSFATYVADQQDLIIRGQIDRWFSEHSNVMLSEIDINLGSVSAEGLQTFHLQNMVGGKLSSEVINEWFDLEVSGKLEEKLAQIEGINDLTLKAAIKQHRDILARLASSKVALTEKITDQLLKVVRLAEGETMIKDTLIKKLVSFKAKDEELLLEL